MNKYIFCFFKKKYLKFYKKIFFGDLRNYNINDFKIILLKE